MSFNIKKPKLRLPNVDIPKALGDLGKNVTEGLKRGAEALTPKGKSLSNLSKNVTEGLKKGIEMVTRNGKSIFSWFGDAFKKLDTKFGATLMSPIVGFMNIIIDYGNKVKKAVKKGVVGESATSTPNETEESEEEEEEEEEEEIDEEEVEKFEKSKYPFGL